MSRRPGSTTRRGRGPRQVVVLRAVMPRIVAPRVVASGAVVPRAALVQLLALALVTGGAGLQVARSQTALAADLAADGALTSTATGGRLDGGPGAPQAARAVSPRVAAPPVELSIPKLEVATRLVGLRIARDGTLGVPTDFARAGWWSQGPAPGDAAPAIIAGHVDDQSGPAVFARLDELTAGDPLTVRRADGTIATFEVRQVHRYAKRDFPTRLVYEGTPGEASLRLITCGGAFDRESGHYRDNTVVFAALVPPG